MGLYEQVDYDFSGPLQPQDLFGREYVTMDGVIDHYCAITYQKAEKARCDNQQRAFSCFGGKCAEPTKFTFHRRSTPSCRSSPTPKAAGSNPPGRTKSSTLWGAALFVLHGFYGAAKEEIRTARAPRLGESLRAHLKSALQCTFAMRFLV